MKCVNVWVCVCTCMNTCVFLCVHVWSAYQKPRASKKVNSPECFRNFCWANLHLSMLQLPLPGLTSQNECRDLWDTFKGPWTLSYSPGHLILWCCCVRPVPIFLTLPHKFLQVWVLAKADTDGSWTSQSLTWRVIAQPLSQGCNCPPVWSQQSGADPSCANMPAHLTGMHHTRTVSQERKQDYSSLSPVRGWGCACFLLNPSDDGLSVPPTHTPEILINESVTK